MKVSVSHMQQMELAEIRYTEAFFKLKVILPVILVHKSRHNMWKCKFFL